MSFIIAFLTVLVYLYLAAFWASLIASLIHFRRRHESDQPLLPMTLIKPVRGLDEGLERNFLSILESDPEGRLQVIIAMESEDDPAYPIARMIAERRPDRDILVLITGPSGERMGKIHNMTRAYARAKHPYVVFSDADVRTTPGMLQETSRAFAKGCDAAFGLPYHVAVPGLGGWCFMVAFNHCFAVPAALNFYLGGYRFCAGAWMGYTRAVLGRVGGLEPFARQVADDYAISRAVSRAGAKVRLIRELVPIRESWEGLGEAVRHLSKWCVIIRRTWPELYFLLPLANLGTASLLLCLACLASGRAEGRGLALLVASAASRVIVGLIQDVSVAGVRMRWWGYPMLALVDVGSLAFWLSGLRSRIVWRGRSYRLGPGGNIA